MDEDQLRVFLASLSEPPSRQETTQRRSWASVAAEADLRQRKATRRRRSVAVGCIMAAVVAGVLLIERSSSGDTTVVGDSRPEGQSVSALPAAVSTTTLATSVTTNTPTPASSTEPGQVLFSIDDLTVTAIPNRGVPPPGANESVGKCFRLTLSAGGEYEACKYSPGPSLWHVADEHYIVALGALPLNGGDRIEGHVPDGVVILPFDSYSDRLEEFDRQCLGDGIADAVISHFGDEQPPYFVSICGDRRRLINFDDDDWIARNVAYGFERPDDEWVFVGAADFSNPDPVERCAAMPNTPIPDVLSTFREHCEALG